MSRDQRILALIEKPIKLSDNYKNISQEILNNSKISQIQQISTLAMIGQLMLQTEQADDFFRIFYRAALTALKQYKENPVDAQCIKAFIMQMAAMTRANYLAILIDQVGKKITTANLEKYFTRKILFYDNIFCANGNILLDELVSSKKTYLIECYNRLNQFEAMSNQLVKWIDKIALLFADLKSEKLKQIYQKVLPQVLRYVAFYLKYDKYEEAIAILRRIEEKTKWVNVRFYKLKIATLIFQKKIGQYEIDYLENLINTSHVENKDLSKYISIYFSSLKLNLQELTYHQACLNKFNSIPSALKPSEKEYFNFIKDCITDFIKLAYSFNPRKISIEMIYYGVVQEVDYSAVPYIMSMLALYVIVQKFSKNCINFLSIKDQQYASKLAGFVSNITSFLQENSLESALVWFAKGYFQTNKKDAIGSFLKSIEIFSKLSEAREKSYIFAPFSEYVEQLSCSNEIETLEGLKKFIKEKLREGFFDSVQAVGKSEMQQAQARLGFKISSLKKTLKAGEEKPKERRRRNSRAKYRKNEPRYTENPLASKEPTNTIEDEKIFSDGLSELKKELAEIQKLNKQTKEWHAKVSKRKSEYRKLKSKKKSEKRVFAVQKKIKQRKNRKIEKLGRRVVASKGSVVKKASVKKSSNQEALNRGLQPYVASLINNQNEEMGLVGWLNFLYAIVKSCNLLCDFSEENGLASLASRIKGNIISDFLDYAIENARDEDYLKAIISQLQEFYKTFFTSAEKREAQVKNDIFPVKSSPLFCQSLTLFKKIAKKLSRNVMLKQLEEYGEERSQPILSVECAKILALNNLFVELKAEESATDNEIRQAKEMIVILLRPIIKNLISSHLEQLKTDASSVSAINELKIFLAKDQKLTGSEMDSIVKIVNSLAETLLKSVETNESKILKQLS